MFGLKSVKRNMASEEKFDLSSDEPVKRRTNRFWCLVALTIVAAIVIFSVGFLIGYFAMKAGTSESPETKGQNTENSESDYKKYHEQAVNTLTAESVEVFSR